MTTQIAVRLPEDLVAFVDAEVAAGRARSRAAVVARALDREHRRELAERDAVILAARDSLDDPDQLDALAEFAATLPDDEG